jgi:hypothetical protein
MEQTATHGMLAILWATSTPSSANWSTKVEFEYLGSGEKRITLVSVPGVTPPTRALDVRQDIALVKIGVNYRFGP